MAFPQHSPPSWPVPSIFPTKSLLSHIFFQHFSPSLPGPTFHSITIYLQVSKFSVSNTTHLSSQHGQTTSACFVASLQQCHQLPACFSPTHCFFFHLNSLLSSISISSFHSSAFSLYPLPLLAMSHCHTTLRVRWYQQYTSNLYIKLINPLSLSIFLQIFLAKQKRVSLLVYLVSVHLY